MPEEMRPILTKERNLIKFWEEAIEHEVKGVKTFDKVLYLKIMVPGDKSEVVYEVEREYPEGAPNPVFGKVKRNELMFKRFGEHIEAWKKSNGAGLVVDGTPIEMWAPVDIRMAAHLKHLGIFSVESLAGLGDSGAAAIGMGGRALIHKASEWVKQKENSSHAAEVDAKNRALEDRLAAMQEQITEMGEAMDALSPEAKTQVQETIKRRRGRPPKVQAA
jgi:hypothetical protein